MRSRAKHGRDRPLHGGPVAIELASLGGKLMLLTFAQIQGPKLSLPKWVNRLGSHETCPLRYAVLLLYFDSLPYCAIGVRYRARKLHPYVFSHATVNSLRILGQRGEGIHRVATHMVPEGEALCLGERPNFHAGLRHDSA